MAITNKNNNKKSIFINSICMLHTKFSGPPRMVSPVWSAIWGHSRWRYKNKNKKWHRIHQCLIGNNFLNMVFFLNCLQMLRWLKYKLNVRQHCIWHIEWWLYACTRYSPVCHSVVSSITVANVESGTHSHNLFAINCFLFCDSFDSGFHFHLCKSITQ